jgi:hypothetical protein
MIALCHSGCPKRRGTSDEIRRLEFFEDRLRRGDRFFDVGLGVGE